MPNWCQNEVSIFGDKKEIKKFIKYIKSDESDFDFNKIYPMPKELEETTSGSEDMKSDEQKANSKKWNIEFGADNWYDWKILHWGTKWELDPKYVEVHELIDDEGCYVEYRFDTAWSPPEGILSRLNEVFKFNKGEDALSIQWFYREDGIGYAGYLDQDLGINGGSF
jgi:hypothetical protein